MRAQFMLLIFRGRRFDPSMKIGENHALINLSIFLVLYTINSCIMRLQKPVIGSLALLTAWLVLVSCDREPSPQAVAAFENLIPKPVSAVAEGGSFFLTDETVIVAESSSEATAVGNFLAGKLGRATGFSFAVSSAVNDPPANAIVLKLTANQSELGDEGYELQVTGEGITLQSNKPAGLMRGVQTIRQLLPESIEMNGRQEGPWEIAGGTI